MSRFYLLFNTRKRCYYFIDVKTQPQYIKQENYLVDQDTGITKQIVDEDVELIQLFNRLLERQAEEKK